MMGKSYGTSVCLILALLVLGTLRCTPTGSRPSTGSLFAITAINPSTGASAGGELITVTGTGITGYSQVAFEGVPCASVSALSDTTITCVTPAHTSGVSDVTLTNTNPQTGAITAVALEDAFTFIPPAPAVTSISPASGFLRGGTTVTLAGTNFSQGDTVTIGGNTCGSLTVVSSTSITCVTGASSVEGVADAVVTDALSRSGTLEDAFTYQLGFAFVDGNGTDGLNKNVSLAASFPSLASFNSKLYIAWTETNGTTTQVRAAVYNENDSSPSWTRVDGNGVNGINKDPTDNATTVKLYVYDSRLLATWRENNGVWQIRVAVYNGNDSSPSWSFIDGNGVNGLNWDPANSALYPHLSECNYKLYIAFSNSNGSKDQLRVAEFNGDFDPVGADWTFRDGDAVNSNINRYATQHAREPAMVCMNSKLYLVWSEQRGFYQIRVAYYNALNFNFLDGAGDEGINFDVSNDAQVPQLLVFSSKMYVLFHNSDGSRNHVRVKVYNGNEASPSFTLVDGGLSAGLNKSASYTALNVNGSLFNSKLYLTWEENNGTAKQIRLREYNGDDSSPLWTFRDGNSTTGFNKDATKAAQVPFIVSHNSKLYLTWYEDNGTATQIRVMVGK